MSEQREMSGILSRNDKRESEKQPEFRGECTIEGKAYRISAWVKEGKSGKFMRAWPSMGKNLHRVATATPAW